MRKIIYILVLLLMLFAASCDRFKHTFEPIVYLDAANEVFVPLQNAFTQITATDISQVMAFYDDNYLNNSQAKIDREAFYLNLFNQSDTLQFNVTLNTASQTVAEDTLSVVTWRLIVRNSAQQVLADSTFLNEELIRRGDTWLLYGNRVDVNAPVTYKQRVFLETFTYVTCPSCPAVEALLHDLQVAHPANLSYLEYHLNDPLNCGNDDVYGYYGYPSMPSVVFQGENKIIGNNAENEQIYNQLVNQLQNTDSKIELSYLNYNVVGQTLTGSIRVKINDQTIDSDLVKLKFAIIDKESDTYTNDAGAACRNVVIAKGEKPLLDENLNRLVNFSLPLNHLPNTYHGALPLDANLVIWVQVTPDTFNSNATVYNALESSMSENNRLGSKK